MPLLYDVLFRPSDPPPPPPPPHCSSLTSYIVILMTLPPYSIHCRCPFRVSEISSSFFPNLKIALLTFLCTSVNQTLTYIVLPLFLRQEIVRRPDKKSPFIYLTYQKCVRFILQISHCDRRSDICKDTI